MPALAEIIQQLHDIAPHYWNKPQTADCTVVIPIPDRKRQDSDANSADRVTLRLHKNYLAAKSSFLRGLLSGVPPHDLIQSRSPQPIHLPRSRMPCLLPSLPSHPIIFLPVPDLSSIHLLIHWVYFGRMDHIENALDQGDIRWQDLVRNVEFLGLPLEIKAFLGRWYRNWLLPSSSRCTPCLTDDDDDDDDDDLDDDWDSDCNYYYSPSTPPTDDGSKCSYRGRSQEVKCIL